MKMRIGVVAGDVQMSTQLQITQLLTVMRRVEQLCLFLKHHGIQDLASNTYEWMPGHLRGRKVCFRWRWHTCHRMFKHCCIGGDWWVGFRVQGFRKAWTETWFHYLQWSIFVEHLKSDFQPLSKFSNPTLDPAWRLEWRILWCISLKQKSVYQVQFRWRFCKPVESQRVDNKPASWLPKAYLKVIRESLGICASFTAFLQESLLNQGEVLCWLWVQSCTAPSPPAYQEHNLSFSKSILNKMMIIWASGKRLTDHYAISILS